MAISALRTTTGASTTLSPSQEGLQLFLSLASSGFGGVIGLAVGDSKDGVAIGSVQLEM